MAKMDPTSSPSDELAQLLADVERIVDGLGGVVELTVRAPVRSAAAPMVSDTAIIRRTLDALRETVADADLRGIQVVAVTVGDLAQLVTWAENALRGK